MAVRTPQDATVTVRVTAAHAEDERGENSPLEDSLGVGLGNLEVLEDHEEDEEVVH